MSSVGTGYDLSASQFSPDGRVFQIEYAKKAIENSGTVIGAACKDGVVLAVEKLVTSKLYETSSNSRIFKIDKHIGVTVAGLLGDCKKVVDIAKREAQSYRRKYGTPVTCKMLAETVATTLHAYTLYSSVRPFGASILFAGCDNGRYSLHEIGPEGIVLEYQACAAGKAKQGAKTELEKNKYKEESVKDLIPKMAKIICSVHDEVKDKAFILEMGVITEGEGGEPPQFRRLNESECTKLLDAAKATLESDDEEDDL